MYLSIFIYLSGFTLTTPTETHQIFFTQQDKSLDQIQESQLEWSDYKNPIFNGTNNGIYWFKIAIHSINEPHVIRVANAHITDYQFYYRNQTLEPMANQRYLAYKIDQAHSHDLFYLKVNCEKEANIPITIHSLSHYRSLNSRNWNIYFAYYGFMLAIVLFSLLSYFQYQDNTYLFYIMLTIGVNIPPAIHEGLFNLVMSPKMVNYIFEPIAHLLCGTFSALFTYKYLRLSLHNNRFTTIVTFFIVLGLASAILFMYFKSYPFFIALDMIMMVILSICAIYGVLNFNRNNYAKFFCIALCPLLLAAYDFYIFPVFGIKLLGLTLDQYRIGNVIELIVFTVAIGFRGKLLATENRNMRLAIRKLSIGGLSSQKKKYEELFLHDKLSKSYFFTNQEIRVFDQILLNKTNREIAEELFISTNTVKFHTRNIYQKLAINNRKEVSDKADEITNEYLCS